MKTERCPTCGARVERTLCDDGYGCLAVGVRAIDGGGAPQRHNCDEWREAIIGCAICHDDYYGVSVRAGSDELRAAAQHAIAAYDYRVKHGLVPNGRIHSMEELRAALGPTP